MRIFKKEHSVFVTAEGGLDMLKVLDSCKLNVKSVKPARLDFEDGWMVNWHSTGKEWNTIKNYIKYNGTLNATCVVR